MRAGIVAVAVGAVNSVASTPEPAAPSCRLAALMRAPVFVPELNPIRPLVTVRVIALSPPWTTPACVGLLGLGTKSRPATVFDVVSVSVWFSFTRALLVPSGRSDRLVEYAVAG